MQVQRKDPLRSVKMMVNKMMKKPNKDQRMVLVEALKAYGKAKASN